MGRFHFAGQKLFRLKNLHYTASILPPPSILPPFLSRQLSLYRHLYHASIIPQYINPFGPERAAEYETPLRISRHSTGHINGRGHLHGRLYVLVLPVLPLDNQTSAVNPLVPDAHYSPWVLRQTCLFINH